MKDFVGRWIAGNDRHTTTTIEIKIVDGHLVVHAIDGSSGERAEIQDLTHGNDEIRFRRPLVVRQNHRVPASAVGRTAGRPFHVF